MKKVVLLVFILSLYCMSCTNVKNVTRYTVASSYADCVGVSPQKCLVVKKAGSDDWQYLYTNIEGFNYIPGYEYVIDVRTEKVQNVPADASSLRYILVKEVSRTPQNSVDPTSLLSVPERDNQAVGRVLSVEEEIRGEEVFSLVKIEVSSSTIDGVTARDAVYAVPAGFSRPNPVIGREYVFKGGSVHENESGEIFLVSVDILDLTR